MTLPELEYRFRLRLIDRALTRTGGNKTKAASLLGIQRTMLVEIIRKAERTTPRFKWKLRAHQGDA